jgi:hypothetical protein
MDTNFESILETVNFVKDRMVTKDDLKVVEERLAGRIDGVDDRLTAVESKISGVRNRLDEEMLRRNDLGCRIAP